MIALDGLWAAHVVRGELFEARRLAERCIAFAASHNDVEATTWANRLAGATLWDLGAFTDARRHLQSAIDLHVGSDGIISSSMAGSDSYILTLTYLARTLFLLGYPEQADATNNLALARSRDLKQPMSVGAALWTVAMLRHWEADPERAGTGADRLAAHCLEFGIGHYLPFARFIQGICLARFGDPREAIEIMHSATDKSNLWSVSPAHPRGLAIAYTRLGQHRVALELWDEAFRRIEKTGSRALESDIRRLRAEALLAAGRKEEAVPEMERALAVARAQDSRWWALLAATALARHRSDHGNHSAADTLLASIYGWFTEGFDLPALKDAKALLDGAAA